MFQDAVRLFEIFLIVLLFLSPFVERLPSQVLIPRRRERFSGAQFSGAPTESTNDVGLSRTAETLAAGAKARVFLRLYLGLLGAVLTIHLLREGAHWQMAPAYVAALLLGVFLLMPKIGRAWRVLAATGIVLLTCMTCCLAAVLPMFKLPRPTGPYHVGTRIVSMTDSSRKEDAIGEANAGPREIVVQIWYPATSSHNPRAPYRRLSETTLASSYQGVDWTDARYDAPAADKRESFPLVLYNPGWNGRRTQDTALAEELASHGYVVAAIDHPFNSGPVQLQGGRVIRPMPTPELFDESSSKQAFYALIDREVEKEADDTLFALTRLTQMNQDGFALLYHTMNLSEVAAIGYSLGGAVAAECAYRNPQIRAVVDLDTPLYGYAGQHGIAQPFLFLGEDLSHVTHDELGRMSFGQRRNLEMDQDDYARQLPLFRRSGDYQLSIHGTLHTSFQDGIFFSPLRSISGAGAIAPDRMNSILRQYTLAFLDQSLRGVPQSLLKTAKSPFSEVTILFGPAAGH